MSHTISTFPEEVLLHIFNFTQPKTRCKIAGVCRVWYLLSKDKEYWKTLCGNVSGRDVPDNYWQDLVISQIKAERESRRTAFFNGGCLNYQPVGSTITTPGNADKLWKRYSKDSNFFFPDSHKMPQREITIFEKTQQCKHVATLSHKENVVSYLISGTCCATLDVRNILRIWDITTSNCLHYFQLKGKPEQYSLQLSENTFVAIQANHNLFNSISSTVYVYFLDKNLFEKTLPDYFFQVSSDIISVLKGSIFVYSYSRSFFGYSQTNKMNVVELKTKSYRTFTITQPLPRSKLSDNRLVWKGFSLFIVAPKGTQSQSDNKMVKWKFSNLAMPSTKPEQLQI